MTDEKIAQVAESFGIPVGAKRIYENEVENYNYIVIRKGRLNKNNSCNSYTRTIKIIYVYDGEQNISDGEIIKAFEDIRLNFKYMDTDDFRVANTDKWADMNTYVFERPEKV